MKPNQHNTKLEEQRKANRKKFAWGTEAFDALNEAFGSLKVTKMVSEDGEVYRPESK